MLAPIIAPLLLIPLVSVALPLLATALAVASPALAGIVPLAALVFLFPEAPGSAGTAPAAPDPNCNARGLTDEVRAVQVDLANSTVLAKQAARVAPLSLWQPSLS